jgi:hypothetical protein
MLARIGPPSLAVHLSDLKRALATRTIVWSLVVGLAFAAVLLAPRNILAEVFSSHSRVLSRAHADACSRSHDRHPKVPSGPR